MKGEPNKDMASCISVKTRDGWCWKGYRLSFLILNNLDVKAVRKTIWKWYFI